MNFIQRIAIRAGNVGIAIYNRLTNPARRLVEVFYGRNVGGVWITHEEAIRLSCVWACITLIAKTIAASRWEIFKEKNNGDRDYMPESRVYHLLNVRPNREMTAMSFKETMLFVALSYGNAYAEIERDVMNRPVSIWPLEPWRCTLVRGRFVTGGFQYDDSGELAVQVANYDKPDTFLPYDNVYHLKGIGWDGVSGLDMIGLAARGLLQGLAAERFALQFYQNGTSLGGVLAVDKDLDQDELDDLRRAVNARVAGVENAFQFLVIGNGAKFQPLTQTMKDGQLTESRNFIIEEACRWWDVPPHKVAHLLHATFSNIEHQGIDFQRGLRPWCRRCEEEADYKLLPVGPVSISINTDWAAEGDAKTKAETDAILVSNALANRNERRKLRGLNSLGPEGDLLTIQSNMTTLKKIQEAPAPGTVRALPPSPEEPEAEDVVNRVAKSLLALAFNRALTRQIRRAEAAVRGAKSHQDFIERLDTGNAAHCVYLQNELAQIETACNDGGIRLTFDKYAVAKKICSDERLMLLSGYNLNGSVTGFIDQSARANALAEEWAKYASKI